MRKGIATAQKNSGLKITIPVKTRTPLEAFQMLRQGSPIDQAAAYYDDRDELPSNFFMLDKTAKLHKLAELRQMEANAQENYTYLEQELSNLNSQNNVKNQEVTQQNATL